MNFLEVLNSAMTHADAITALLARISKGKEALLRLLPQDHGLTYENAFIDEELDIQDAQGRRAVLRRRQGVKVLTKEPPIVRHLCWGDGDPLANYRVQGARRVGVASEGMKTVVLLGLSQSAARATRILETRRLIRDEFTDRRGYFELQVERPTKRFSLAVVFPARRPPRETEIISMPSGPHAQLIKRRRRDGRTALLLTLADPVPFTQYHVSWSW